MNDFAMLLRRDDESRRASWAGDAVVVGCFAGIALLAGGLLQSVRPLDLPLYADGHYYFIQMVSLLVDGDLDFANQYAAFGDPLDNVHYEVTRGIGNALMVAPFFGVGRVVATVLGHHDVADPEAASWLLGACRSAPLFYACFGAALIFRNARLRARPVWRRGAIVAAIVFGTPLWPYLVWFPLYNHALTFFLTAGLWYVAELPAAELRVVGSASPRTAYARWAGGGVLLGLALTTRPELAAFSLLLLVPWSERKARAPGLLLAGTIASALFALQWFLFQTFGKITLPHRDFLQLGHPHLLRLLHSPRNGFFYQQPVVWLGALVLLATEWRHARGRLLLVSMGAVLWINASAWDPWGGYSVGARRLIPVLPFIALGLTKVSDVVLDYCRANRASPGLVRWLSVAGYGLLVTGTAYRPFALTDARASAIERGMPAPESAMERVVGKVTAYPLLVWMQLESSASLDKVYRIASLNVLFRWPKRSWSVDRIVESSGRFADLHVEQRLDHDWLRHGFFLPLHRTPAARARVRIAPEGPVVALWDGEPAKITSGPPGYVSFDVRSGALPGAVWFEVITNANAELLEIILEGP